MLMSAINKVYALRHIYNAHSAEVAVIDERLLKRQQPGDDERARPLQLHTLRHRRLERLGVSTALHQRRHLKPVAGDALRYASQWLYAHHDAIVSGSCNAGARMYRH